MAFKAIIFEVHKGICQNGQETTLKIRTFDCIYDDEPLGFEKDPLASTKRMQAQYPLEEIDLRDGTTKRSTYISVKLDISLKIKVIEILREFKY